MELGIRFFSMVAVLALSAAMSNANAKSPGGGPIADLNVRVEGLERKLELLELGAGTTPLFIEDANGLIVGPLLGTSLDSLVTERVIRGKLWRIITTRDDVRSDRLIYQFGVYETENCSGYPQHFDPAAFERSVARADLWAGMLPMGYHPSLGQFFALPKIGVSPSYVYARSYNDQNGSCVNAEGDRLAFGLNDLDLIDPVEGLTPPFAVPVLDP